MLLDYFTLFELFNLGFGAFLFIVVVVLMCVGDGKFGNYMAEYVLCSHFIIRGVRNILCNYSPFLYLVVEMTAIAISIIWGAVCIAQPNSLFLAKEDREMSISNKVLGTLLIAWGLAELLFFI